MSVRMIERLAPQAFQAIAEELGLADELLIDAETVFVEEAKADMANTLPTLADIYARHFTPEELRDLRAFYDTPLGCKMLLVEPRIHDDWQSFSLDWARTVMMKVLARLEARPAGALRASA